MQIIPLQAIPNQQIQVTLENTLFNLRFATRQGFTYATITVNNVVVVSGVRCTPGFQIMPSRYMEGQAGNFTFATNNDEYPIYDQFQVTQFLLYATAAELAAARADYVPI